MALWAETASFHALRLISTKLHWLFDQTHLLLGSQILVKTLILLIPISDFSQDQRFPSSLFFFLFLQFSQVNIFFFPNHFFCLCNRNPNLLCFHQNCSDVSQLHGQKLLQIGTPPRFSLFLSLHSNICFFCILFVGFIFYFFSFAIMIWCWVIIVWCCWTVVLVGGNVWDLPNFFMIFTFSWVDGGKGWN